MSRDRDRLCALGLWLSLGALFSAPFLVALLETPPARSQIMPVGSWIQGGGCTAHYCGPGDVTPFTAWYSCTRAYSFAYAQPGTNKACLLNRVIPSSNFIESQCVLYLKPNGNADFDTTLSCSGGTETVDTWGQYRSSLNPNAVGTGSCTGTVLTITAMTSGTWLPYMWISSGSIYITSYGTGTGGTGTYNLSASCSLGSGTRTGVPATIKVNTYYDQTFNSACGGTPCDLVKTHANATMRMSWGGDSVNPCTSPTIRPCTLITDQSSTPMSYESANNITPVDPVSVANVSMHKAYSSAPTSPLFYNRGVQCGGWVTATSAENSILFNSPAGGTDASQDTWSIGSGLVNTAARDAVHSAVGVASTASTSFFNVDGSTVSDPSGTNFSGASAHVRVLGRDNGGTHHFYEGGCANGVGFDSTTRAAILANEKAYYGTP